METDRIARPPAPPGIEVEVVDNQSRPIIDPDFLQALARRVLDSRGVVRASISIVLVDDPTIHEINRRHLGHDWPTDVITFPLSESGEPTLAGELVVSADMAHSTAAEAGIEPRLELALYVVHGLLHLCGLDDQSPEDVAEMRRAEAEALALSGLVNTFPLVGLARPCDEGRKGERWPQ